MMRSMSLKPDYAQAYNNLGVVQRELDRSDAAIASQHGPRHLSVSRLEDVKRDAELRKQHDVR